MDLSKMKLAYKKGKGEEQKWYINPYLFVMIALELDPKIYTEVIMWLTDGFIEDRNEAGDAYVKMCSALYRMANEQEKKLFKEIISSVAIAINYIVFNKHEDGIRNMATKSELNDIISMENIITGIAVDNGFAKNIDEVINYLRREWKRRWGNPIDKIKIGK